MKYIETIKIVNGIPMNIDCHADRMRSTSGLMMPEIVVPDSFCDNVIKCRILYDSEISEISFSAYTTPKIRSLAIIESPDIEYSKKYADRRSIDNLFNKRGAKDDILIVRNGNISDTSFCNVVFESPDGLFTPDTPLLEGTKRSMLISADIIRPCRITINDLWRYNSAHLINAMLDLEDNVTVRISNIQILH